MLGIIIGRDSEGRRFVAHTPSDEATLANLEATEAVGRTGQVSRSDDGKRNIFIPD
jgi:acetyl-CoA C-acetyltransferase